MSQSPTTIFLDRILEQDPESVMIWVKNIFSGQTDRPQDFNWLLLADVASTKARKGENKSGLFDRTWAEVAVFPITNAHHLLPSPVFFQSSLTEDKMLVESLHREAMELVDRAI